MLLAAVVVVLGAGRLAQAFVHELAYPTREASRPAAQVRAAFTREIVPAARRPTEIHREAVMTPLRASMTYLPEHHPGRVVAHAVFGTSSRYAPTRRLDRDRDEDDGQDTRSRREGGTFRTLCVRLCDGYYHPISFATTREHFARDARACAASCGGGARLFIHANPGGDAETMVDLNGQPYRRLAAAFLYRREYIAACRCRPNPWEAEVRERHRLYALAAAKRKGNSRQAAQSNTPKARLEPRATKRPAQPAAHAHTRQQAGSWLNPFLP